jgi:CBS domain-containing protein
MKVRDVMTVEVVTTTPETPLRAVAKTLATTGIAGMPVVDSDGQVVGVISEADILAKERRELEDDRGRVARMLHRTPEDTKRDARTVGDAMTSPAVVIPSFASIATAAGRMLEHDVNRLPVVDRDRLVGIVSRADLVRAFVRSDDEIAADAREQVSLQQALAGDANVIDVEVMQGDIVLTGAVRRRSDADLIPRLVRGVPGVVEVRSELSWSERD